MEIGKYIHGLLLENDMVIIPGFGAFVSNYKPAEIDEQTNVIKPPSKEIIFNKDIRNNDGLLVGSVARGEAVSHFDALKLIEKERENIIYELDKGNKVTIGETGELFVNDKNEIVFVAFEDENLLLDSYGLETVELEKPAEQKEEKEVVVADVSAEEPDEESETKEEEVAPAEQEVVEDTAEKTEESVVTPVNEEKEEKKKRGGYWFLLILIPVIFVGFFLYRQQGDKNVSKKQVISKPEKVVQTEPAAKPDTVKQDTAVTEKTVPDTIKIKEETPVKTEPEVEESPKYYLVGGSFKEKKNADDYLEELKKKGLEPFHLGKRGNFYIIGIGKFNSGEKAFAAKRDFMEKYPGSGVWVMVNKEKK